MSQNRGTLVSLLPREHVGCMKKLTGVVLKSQSNRVRISQIAKATVDGGGTNRICDLAEAQL